MSDEQATRINALSRIVHKALEDGVGDREAAAAAIFDAIAPVIAAAVREASVPRRRQLPADRHGKTKRFKHGEHTLYATPNSYEDGRIGEIWLRFKLNAPPVEPATVAGLLDMLSIAIAGGLQYGMPVSFLIAKFEHLRFPPAADELKPGASMSFGDAIAKWLRALLPDEAAEANLLIQAEGQKMLEASAQAPGKAAS